MKESFGQLYSRLYRENFEELEGYRKKLRVPAIIFILIIVAMILLLIKSPVLFAIIEPILVFSAIIYLIVKITTGKAKKTNGVSYIELFKEKIVAPIIANVLDEAKYTPNAGISESVYRQSGYNEYYEIFHSEDLVEGKLNENSRITFSEVKTETESTDSDGNREKHTVFSGLSGFFELSKEVTTNVYIRSNWRVTKWNKNKVKLDMSEFEKIFDVESGDKILAMRLLTSDIMAQMIDLYKKYKYKFEISIIKNTVYLRLMSGPMFEPNLFGKSVEYKQLERYYLVLKALTSIGKQIYNVVNDLEI